MRKRLKIAFQNTIQTYRVIRAGLSSLREDIRRQWSSGYWKRQDGEFEDEQGYVWVARSDGDELEPGYQWVPYWTPAPTQ